MGMRKARCAKCKKRRRFEALPTDMLKRPMPAGRICDLCRKREAPTPALFAG